jgi:hypothetical protein
MAGIDRRGESYFKQIFETKLSARPAPVKSDGQLGRKRARKADRRGPRSPDRRDGRTPAIAQNGTNRIAIPGHQVIPRRHRSRRDRARKSGRIQRPALFLDRHTHVRLLQADAIDIPPSLHSS